MIDQRHLFVLRFRELAERFPTVRWLDEHKAEEEAGNLVMAAYHLGYLALPGLADLVAWVENPPPCPEGVQAWLVPCASNLFSELCGYNRIPARNLGNKRWEIIGDHVGGILPRLLSDSPALHRPRQNQSMEDQACTMMRQRALTCTILAGEIERTSRDDARDCWIYERARAGHKWQWIVDNLPKWCVDGEQITTVQGAKKAADKFAQKHGLPGIESRKSGRPRKI
jgi:hypothetical protein